MRCHNNGGDFANVMVQMGKDKPITFKNLVRICNALDCIVFCNRYTVQR